MGRINKRIKKNKKKKIQTLKHILISLKECK